MASAPLSLKTWGGGGGWGGLHTRTGPGCPPGHGDWTMKPPQNGPRQQRQARCICVGMSDWVGSMMWHGAWDTRRCTRISTRQSDGKWRCPGGERDGAGRGAGGGGGGGGQAHLATRLKYTPLAFSFISGDPGGTGPVRDCSV